MGGEECTGARVLLEIHAGPEVGLRVSADDHAGRPARGQVGHDAVEQFTADAVPLHDRVDGADGEVPGCGIRVDAAIRHRAIEEADDTVLAVLGDHKTARVVMRLKQQVLGQAAHGDHITRHGTGEQCGQRGQVTGGEVAVRGAHGSSCGWGSTLCCDRR